MPFPTGHLNDPAPVGPGELVGTDHQVIAFDQFENGLKEGHFAKVNSGALENVDGSSSPVIAGVVRRKIEGPIEHDNQINSDRNLHLVAESIRGGLATVQAVSGQTPSMFDTVFVSNAGDADDGKATLTDDTSTVAGHAEFVRVEDDANDIWLVNLNPAL